MVSHSTAPATLGNWQQNGMDLSLYCTACDAHKLLSVDELVEPLGQDFPVPSVGEIARCSRCGNLGAEVKASVRSTRK